MKTNMSLPISPVTRSKATARNNYNRLSRWYDLVSGSTEKKYREYGLRELNAREGEHVLEIGFGTGHCLLALARAVGSRGQVFGLDLSEGMAAISRQRLQKAGLVDRVDLRVGDATCLPFDPGSLDAVFMSFTLELFDTPELPVVLEQIQRALRPAGRLCVVTMSQPEKPGIAVRLYEWFHARMPDIVDCRPIPAQHLLEEAGFKLDKTTSMIMWGLPVEIILAHT